MKGQVITPPCVECGMSQVFWVETEDERIAKATAAGWKDGMCGLCNKVKEEQK